MNVVRRLFYVVVALAGLCLAAGLFLPKSVHVERSIATAASPSTVYGIVNGFRRFNEWSPWFDLDPRAKYTYAGPQSGIGAKMTWTSQQSNVGSGSRIVWAFDASFEHDYFGRYMGLLFDRFIGKDYEKGLSKLKTIAEATPAAP